MFQRMKKYYQQSCKQVTCKIKHAFKGSPIWHIHKESVARGVGIGLFIALTPIIPLQTIVILLLSILLRANFVIAFAVSWVSNPLTIIPITYCSYLIGQWILDRNHHPILLQQYHRDTHESLWMSFSHLTQQFGKAFIIGMPILAVSVGLLGYILVLLLWHLIPAHYKKNK